MSSPEPSSAPTLEDPEGYQDFVRTFELLVRYFTNTVDATRPGATDLATKARDYLADLKEPPTSAASD